MASSIRLRGFVVVSVLCATALAVQACSGGGETSGGGGATTAGAGGGTASGGGGGALDCDAGFGSGVCDGKCVDTLKDPKNCGGCGNVCGAAELCCSTFGADAGPPSAVCAAAASCGFIVAGVSQKKGWQNGGDYLTLSGAGFAPGMRVLIAGGRAPVRVIDGAHALVQTPPGPLGLCDIEIDLGAAKAVLPKGFEYVAAGLMTPWEQKPMASVRGEDPGVAVMQDGRVLIAGGTTVPDSIALALDTAEIYTRSTDKVTAGKNAMSAPRWQNSAVTLLDGRVLVVGGACLDDLSMCNGDATSADLFDPKTDTFAPTKGKLSMARAYTRSVLLPDGRVLVSSANDASLEVFDPATETFTLIPGLGTHVFGFMVRLRDGRVLFGGGDANPAVELFDPDTNTVKATGPLVQARSMLTAHTLPDGRVMIFAGASVSAGAIQDPLDTIEAFDPKAGTFSALPYKLGIGRCWHASALVRDGTILVMGGYTIPKQCDSLASSVDQVDPVKGTVKTFAVLPNANTEWNAVTLLDGSVLGVGGGACGAAMALPDSDFLPGAPVPQ